MKLAKIFVNLHELYAESRYYSGVVWTSDQQSCHAKRLSYYTHVAPWHWQNIALWWPLGLAFFFSEFLVSRVRS